MKKGLIIILMLLALIGVVEAASTNGVIVSSGIGQVDLRIEILKYVPAPVEPGEYFDLWIGIEAQGSQIDTSIINFKDLQNVELEFVENYPFSLNKDDSPIAEFGVLKMGEQVTAKYRVKVDDSALPGENEIYFKIRANDNEMITPMLNINVKSFENTLNIAEIETDPEQLSPGKSATLSITLSNDALADLRNLKVVLGIDGNSIPIVPYKSSKEQNLRSLSAGKDYTFTFDIIPEEDAVAGVYKIPLQITYSDANNSVFYRNDTFGILIGAQADLEYNLEEFDTFQENTKGKIVVSVSNIGPTETKYMSLQLIEGEGYEIIGPSEEYLGNLESDDFETSTFNIYVTTDEDLPINFVAKYKDTYNQEFEENFTLILPVYTKSEIKKYGLDGDTAGYWMALFYIIGALFLYYSYKGWKKDKKLDLAVRFGLKKIIQLPIKMVLFFRPKNLKKIPKKIEGLFDDL